MDPLWLELLNSNWHDYLGSGRSEDRLDSPRWLEAFLARWELAPSEVATDESREALRSLRSQLQGMVAILRGGEPPRDEDLEALNSFLAAGPLVCRVERDQGACQLRLVPVERTLNAVVSEIAASFAEVLVEGDARRIKICENPDCKWVFYDRSRNRTRRWCEGPTGCGNLLKVRRFRARRKADLSHRQARPPAS